MFKLSLMPKDKRFSILFEQGAENIVKMAKEFSELVNTWDNIRARVEVLADFERDGDAITHEVMALLNRTFITPFDREDISLIAQSLDDIADGIHAAAQIMLLYKIESPTDRAKELADIVLQVTKEVEHAISEIGGNMDRKKMLNLHMEINRLQNLGNDVYHTALGELFVNVTDIPYVIKWREIYGLIESPIDKGEHIADVIQDVAIKYS